MVSRGEFAEEEQVGLRTGVDHAVHALGKSRGYSSPSGTGAVRLSSVVSLT